MKTSHPIKNTSASTKKIFHFNQFKKGVDLELGDQFTFFATCGHYLEPLVADELKKMGVEDVTPLYLGVGFKTTLAFAMQIILKTKLASGIFLNIHRDMIVTPNDLSKLASELPWQEMISSSSTFTIESVLASIRFEDKQAFNSPLFVSQKFKDGIFDYFNGNAQTPPELDPKNHDIKLKLMVTGMNDAIKNIRGYEISIYFDMSNFNLGNRGFRPPKMTAPLRETLACALVKNMEIKDNELFIDGMCGSGTLGLEYLLEKMKLPGQYLNIMNEFYPYAFLKAPWFNRNPLLKTEWKKISSNLHKYIYEKLGSFSKNPINLVFNDFNKQNLKDAVLTLKLSKLPCKAEFTNFDITGVNPTELKKNFQSDNLVVICNPPYGVRMEHAEEEKLAALYFNIGENMKKQFKGSRFFIFSANTEMLKKVRLRPIKKLPFFNGALESKFYEYPLH